MTGTPLQAIPAIIAPTSAPSRIRIARLVGIQQFSWKRGLLCNPRFANRLTTAASPSDCKCDWVHMDQLLAITEPYMVPTYTRGNLKLGSNNGSQSIHLQNGF